MDFELSDDQEALQEVVRKLCAGAFPMATIRSLEDRGGVERDLWRRLADAGVFSLHLPESAGGAGLGSCESVLVFEELGRALVPGPLVPTKGAHHAHAVTLDRPDRLRRPTRRLGRP